VLIGALARLQPASTAAQDRLKKELDNDRTNVRRVAVDALVAIGDPSTIDVLLEKRNKEESPRMVRDLDSAIEKLRAKERSLEQLQRELSELRAQNKKLEERLQALEQKK
jgi:HEAT repeat protein